MSNFQIKNISIRTKLWILTSMLVVFTIGAVTVISSRITTNFITEEAKRDLASNTQMFSQRIELICNETAVFSKMAISNKGIQDFSENVRYWSFSEDLEIKRLLIDFIAPRTFIETMNFYYNTYDIYFSSNVSLETSPFFQDHIDTLESELTPNNREIWGLPFYSNELKHFLLPYYRKIYFGKSGKQLGFLESFIPVKLFNSSIENSIFAENGSLYIINEEGIIIIHNDESRLLKSIEASKLDFLKKNLNKASLFDESILCHTKTIPERNWIIVNEVPKAVLLVPAKEMKFNFLIIGIIALFCTVFLSFRLSTSIMKPIIEMEHSISTMENLESRKYVPIHALDEIGKLGKQYNHMIDRIAQAAEFERKRDVQIKQYELALLQSQIKPHFLNNILENICGLIELERIDDSLSLIQDTADFYRSILSTDNLLISLEQELKIVTLYIKIQNVRCNNRIRLEIDVPEHYYEKQIVKLTLQPLTENAIQHGMDLCGNPLNIRIDCIENEHGLIMRVHDSGVGMSQEILDNILKTERKTSEGKPMHIGVYATDQRLKLHFGNQHGLKYSSVMGSGTTAEIHLPWEIEI
jgi:two-component system, sensor histidine kinase YesM